jgi:hypothetical protein
MAVQRRPFPRMSPHVGMSCLAILVGLQMLASSVIRRSLCPAKGNAATLETDGAEHFVLSQLRVSIALRVVLLGA